MAIFNCSEYTCIFWICNFDNTKIIC